MQEIWDRIEAWLRTHAVDVMNELAEGASEEDIQHAENELGYHFPEPFRASLRIHNGAGDFVDGWALLNLGSVRTETTSWRRAKYLFFFSEEKR